MIDNLIPMSDYVILEDSVDYIELDNKELLDPNKTIIYMQSLSRIINYAKFLKQPLTIGMFVPVDKQGNVLYGKPLSPAPDSEWIRWENEQEEYFKAKENVIFEGFEYVNADGCHIVMNSEYQIFFNKYSGKIELYYKPEDKQPVFKGEINTIEDLVHLKLKLTEQGKKQFTQ